MPKVERPTLPNLIGGISQLNEAVRVEGQVEALDNGYPSPESGLMKRPPTEHVSKLRDADSGDATIFAHVINRSDEDQYMLLINGSGDLEIYDLSDGTQMTVNIDSTIAASDYAFDSDDPNLRVLDAADLTILLNRQLTPAMTSDRYDSYDAGGGDLRSASAQVAFYWIRNTDYLHEYRVRVHTVKENGDLEPPQTTSAEHTENESWVKTHNGTFGNEINGTAEHTPAYDPNNGLYEGYQIPVSDAAEVATLLFAQTEVTASGYTTTYPGGIREVYEAQSGENMSNLFNFNQSQPPQVGSVCALSLGVRDKTDGDYRKSVHIEVVKASGQNSGDMTAFDGTGGIQSADDLPPYCIDSMVVPVKGDPADPAAVQHYFEFTLFNQDFPNRHYVGDGEWAESMASLSAYKIDANTMPIKIERVIDSAEPNGYSFTVEPIDWNDKVVGDSITDPEPSFIGSPIKDLAFVRNRLCFLTETSVVMSAADDFFNFWRSTVRQVVDGDPIDVVVGKGVQLDALTPFEDALVVWSDREQFLVDGRPLLTPSSVRSTPIAAYEADLLAHPRVSATGIFFARRSVDRTHSQISELRKIDEARFDAVDVSQQIPRYIRGRVLQIEASASEGALVVRTDDDDDALTFYLYKWLDSGGRRIQGAWSRQILGAGSFGSIRGLRFIDNILHLAVYRSSTLDSFQEVNHERMVLSPQRQDVYPHDAASVDDGSSNTSDYLALIDRRLTDNDVTITYDYGDQELDIELPYVLTGASATTRATPVVVSRINTSDTLSPEAYPEGVEYEVASVSLTTLSAAEKRTVLHISDPDQELWTALGSPTAGSQNRTGRSLRLWIGEAYELSCELTRLQLIDTLRPDAERLQNPQPEGRLVVERGFVRFEDTGHLEVEVAPAAHRNGTALLNRDTFTYALNPYVHGVNDALVEDPNIRDGTLEFSVRSDPRWVKITLKNGSYLPSNIRSLSFLSNFTPRSTRGRG